MNGKFLIALLFTAAYVCVLSAPNSEKYKRYQLHPSDSTSAKVLQQFPFKISNKADTIEWKQNLYDYLKRMQTKGFLSASIDSIETNSQSSTGVFYAGERTRNVRLSIDSITAYYLGIKLNKLRKSDTLIAFQQWDVWKESCLKSAENNGYPFARIDNTVREWEGGSFKNQVHLELNDFIVMDTIIINGQARVRNKFLAAYLGIKKGSAYDESRILKISRKISDLGFLEETAKPQISFLNNKARVELFLKNKKSSRFDGIIGFLPNNAQTGKWLITGQARIEVVNPFGTGNHLLIEWQKLQPRTQRLQASLNYQYILNLPIGVDAYFDLYKRDTQYLDLNYRIAAQYHFSGNNTFSAVFEYKSTRLIQIDQTRLLNEKALPSALDTRLFLYGIDYSFHNLNYKYNPIKGWDIQCQALAGTKKVQRNNTISNLVNSSDGRSFSYLYDSLSIKPLQFQFSASINKFWSLHKRATLLTGVKAKAIFAQKIYFNEQFRIGGNRIMRGFDEESIFTPWYTVATLEFRFLFMKNSYVFAFYDQGLVKDARFEQTKVDYPLGFGAGVSLETKIGVFAIHYALGRQYGNNIDFRSSKIHVGYVNYF